LTAGLTAQMVGKPAILLLCGDRGGPEDPGRRAVITEIFVGVHGGLEDNGFLNGGDITHFLHAVGAVVDCIFECNNKLGGGL
jgi:hypothetical protein